MNYQDAMNLTGWDFVSTFWWVGLIAAGLAAGAYAKWITPRKR